MRAKVRNPLRWMLTVTLVVLTLVPSSAYAAGHAPLPIRVVVVTAFQNGADTDDAPGELRLWVARLPMPETLDFPAGIRHLRLNRERGVLAIVVGQGAERSAASIMALGLDPRFDLSKAYWLVAGIAGVDPNVASVGSAAWAEWVVNSDLGYDIDARDIPPTWSTGILPFGRSSPFEQPAPPAHTSSWRGDLAFALNSGLVHWAFHLTSATLLADDANLAKVRAPYARFPNAHRAPFVLRGDDLDGDRFLIGAHMNAWAERWVAYWSGGRGHYAMAAQEDAGIVESLTQLAHAGRVDFKRVLVLRTASNFDEPPPGESIARHLAHEQPGALSAFREALEAAYRVASPVVVELSKHWARYRTDIPSAP